MRRYFRNLPFPPFLLIVGIVVLSFLVSTQYFFASQFFSDHERKTTDYAKSWMVPVINYTFWALLAPLIYRISKKLSFDRPNIPPTLLMLLAGGLILAVLHEVSSTGLFFLRKLLDVSERASVFDVVDGRYLRYGIFSRFLEYLVILTVFMAVDYYKRYVKSAVTLDAMALDLNEARLTALKAQLQPHFLFNTLNTITALIDEDKVAAQQVTLKLSNILRDILQASEESGVTLKEEIAFIRNFLDIEQIRYGPRLDVQILVEHGVKEVLIPHLILQPLVENSFKHGFKKKLGKCHLSITAKLYGLGLMICVEDDGAPAKTKGSLGIGLSNVERRLDHFFQGRVELSASPRPDGGHQTTIIIQHINDKTSNHRRRRASAQPGT
ncbi:MAG: histidine kinase [Bacteroidota bacterium]